MLLMSFSGTAAAQSLPPAPDVVAALPGFGRPIDVEAARQRRARVAERSGTGVIAIPANVARDLEARVIQDNDFRQNDYFFYLTGLEAPGAWLVMTTTSTGTTTTQLLLPRRRPRQEVWTGKKLGPGPEAAQLIGIATVRPVEELESALHAALAESGGPLHLVLDPETRQNQWIHRWTTEGAAFRDLTPLLDSLRMVKDDAELTRLRRAIDITVLAHRQAMRGAAPGMFEYEIEALIEYTFRSHGADRLGFPSIVGSGPNSTTLHYDVNRRRTAPGDLVVIDIGAEYGQYSADVTRTIPLSGTFTERQKAIYNLVLGTQQAAIDSVRPGITIRDLERIARRYMQEHSGNLCGQTPCTRFFRHGLSHWLGMRVHDVGDYNMPLEPGMVFTIEPGIYIEDEHLGVRIEDDVLVTETGGEVLSAGAPRTVEEIEALMRSDRPIP